MRTDRRKETWRRWQALFALLPAHLKTPNITLSCKNDNGSCLLYGRLVIGNTHVKCTVYITAWWSLLNR
jgi:hypothetical protein